MDPQEQETRAAAGGRGTGRRPTVDDVARLAGVSRQTVSRVVNGSSPVSVRTRSRVESVVAELGYAPDPAAQRLGRYRRSGEPVTEALLGHDCLAAIATLRSAGLVVHLREQGTSVEVELGPAVAASSATGR